MTSVTVGDGRNTDFLNDTWLLDAPLADRLPALHSHADARVRSVHDIVHRGIANVLQRRLSTQASQELALLTQLLGDVTLTSAPNERYCSFETEDHKLRSGLIYRASMRGEQTCPAFDFVWRNFAPPRVKFLGWLLTSNRIQCKTSLRRKHILQNADRDICGAPEETADHIMSGCPFARSFWRHIGWHADAIAPVDELWKSTPALRHVPGPAVISLILLCCWELWKHRNDVVFRGLAPNLNRIMAACKEEIALWCCRLPRKSNVLPVVGVPCLTCNPPLTPSSV